MNKMGFVLVGLKKLWEKDKLFELFMKGLWTIKKKAFENIV